MEIKVPINKENQIVISISAGEWYCIFIRKRHLTQPIYNKMK